jgi:nicotinate-nucleotide--dimethylbenzimidazole phosphoribosyltransferase
MNLNEINNQIPDLNKIFMNQAKSRWDSIAKPLGSLGVFEEIITQISGITEDVDISKRAVIILAADNGVTAHGVSSASSDVTAILAELMSKEISSACIMAKSCNCDIILRDMGMFKKIDDIAGCHIADGTKDIFTEPAMSEIECETAIKYGIELVKQAKADGYRLLATGEMGIGNTTTSAAIAAVLLGESVSEIAGRGVGLDDEKYQNKIKIIEKAININAPYTDSFDVLRKLGGFDIAGLCGVFIGGALYGIPIIIDGIISSVAALVASKLCPKCKNVMIASHVSAEPAAMKILAEIGVKPIIHAGMRLGEGTGAVALIPLLDMAVAVYKDMLTYGDLGI